MRVTSQDLEQSSAAPSSVEQDDGAAGARGGLQAVAEADAAVLQQRCWQGARSTDTASTLGLQQGPAPVGMGPGAGSKATSEAHLQPPAGAAQAAAAAGEQAPATGSTAVAARARMARSLLSDAMKSAGSAGLSHAGSSHSHSSPGPSSVGCLPSGERQSPASSTGQRVAAAQPHMALHTSHRQPSDFAGTGLAATSVQPPAAQQGLHRQSPAPEPASAACPAPLSDERQRGSQRGDAVPRSRLLSGRRLSEGLHPAALRAAAAAAAFGDPFEVEANPVALQQPGCNSQQQAVEAPLEQSQASPDRAPSSLGECPQDMQQGCRAAPGYRSWHACRWASFTLPVSAHTRRSSCLTFWLPAVLLCMWVKAWET